MSDEDLLIRVGLTEQKYLQSLARMEAGSVRSARRNENAFRRSNDTFVRGVKSADRAASNAAHGGMRAISMQLSQVASQGAVTGNYLQAMAIQAPDLALAFGPLGIMLGALVPVLYGVAEGALNAKGSLEDIKLDVGAAYGKASSAIDAAKEAQDRYTAAIRLSGAAQSEVTPAILGSLQLEAKAREALAAVEVARLERQRRALVQEIEKQRAELQGFVDDALGPLTSRSEQDLSSIVPSKMEEKRLAIVRDVLAANDDLVLSLQEQNAELDLVNALISQGHGEASAVVDELIAAAGAGTDTAIAIESIDFGGAISGAVDLAAKLDISLHKAMQIMGLVGAAAQKERDSQSGPELDPRSPKYDPIAAEMQRIQDEGYNRVPVFAPSRAPRVEKRSSRSGRRSGAVSKVDREQSREQAEHAREAQRYIEQTRTEIERYNEELRLLDDLNQKGFFKESPEAYARAVASVNEEFKHSQNEKFLEGMESVSHAMAQAVVDGENMGDALRGVFQRIAADLLASGIQNMLMQLFAGGLVGGGGLLGGGGLFAGFFDKGGTIPSGKFGIAGENGPEIIRGPAHVTSTAATARALSGGGTTVEVHNYSGQQVRTESTVLPGGGRREDVIIGNMVAGVMDTPGTSANRSLRRRGAVPGLTRY